MPLLPATGWSRVLVTTVLGTAFCIAIALYVDSFNFAAMSPDAVERAIWQNLLVPAGLAGPMLFFVMFQMRRLALVQDELRIAATTDNLTSLLNRGAFKMLVEAYLDAASKRAETRSGAMLVIDADHFKAVNDRFGHDSGDEALKLIASSISGTLRSGDLVGRLGGEEFGVFLPGAASGECIEIAERIRSAIATAEFRPKATSCPLTVSIGGTAFNKAPSYDRLYAAADECLFEAKRLGRNKVQWRRTEENAEQRLSA